MPDRRARRWRVSDLVTDPVNGKLKETLLWSNAGKASALVWFSWKCYKNTDTPDIWLIVMVVLTAHAIFSQLIMSRFGGSNNTAVTTTAAITTTVNGDAQ